MGSWMRSQRHHPSENHSGWFGRSGHEGHVVSTNVSCKYCWTSSEVSYRTTLMLRN